MNLYIIRLNVTILFSKFTKHNADKNNRLTLSKRSDVIFIGTNINFDKSHMSKYFLFKL